MRRHHPPSGHRGSALIVAMLFAALIAIALGSYIKMALNSTTLADRSYYQNAAINLAEVGIEAALYCYNQLDDVPNTSPQDAWLPQGWTLGADTATRTLGGFTPGPGVTGTVKIHCTYFNPTRLQKPIVVAQATLIFPQGPPLSKNIEVTLRRRALFPKGMVVRDFIRASGGSLSLDSWDSGDDGDPSTPMVTYSTTTRRANATLATLSSRPAAIDMGNGNVYGYISTAEGGTVAYGSTAVLSGDFAGTTFELDRVSHDFDVTAFPPVTVPSRSAAWIDLPATVGGNVTFPRAGDTPAADGCYYYNFPIGTNISSNSGTLRVTAKVVFILTNHAGVDAMTFGGGSGMEIASGAALRVYTNGNVLMGGSGFLSNGNVEPSTCMFYGTNGTAGGQDFLLRGNGHTAVCLYGPNANITMSGGGSGGDFYGAIVGNSVTMNGTTRFHYDEALARLLFTGNPYGIEKWREHRTASERALLATRLNF